MNLSLHFRPGGRKPPLPKCAGGLDGSRTGARVSCQHSVCAVTSAAGGSEGREGAGTRRWIPGIFLSLRSSSLLALKTEPVVGTTGRK